MLIINGVPTYEEGELRPATSRGLINCTFSLNAEWEGKTYRVTMQLDITPRPDAGPDSFEIDMTLKECVAENGEALDIQKLWEDANACLTSGTGQELFDALDLLARDIGYGMFQAARGKLA